MKISIQMCFFASIVYLMSILMKIMRFYYHFRWFCTYFEGFSMILEVFWWFWDGKSMKINENVWNSMKNEWKSAEINGIPYKIAFFRIHLVVYVDFDENCALSLSFWLILHVFWMISNDFLWFLVYFGWKINENQWKWTKIKTIDETQIERGSSHVVYDVVAAAFAAKYDVVVVCFKEWSALDGRVGICAVRSRWDGGRQCKQP